MMYDQDDLKVRLVDLGKDEIIYCRDEQIPENILHVRKAEIYIGKYGFQYDIGGREGLYSYYYANYGDTWAFTESDLKVSPTGTVYVVTCGDYSEYHIEKVFLNKENAERYVNAKNNLIQTAGRYSELMEIEEFDAYDRFFLKEVKGLEDRVVRINYNPVKNQVYMDDADQYNYLHLLSKETLTTESVKSGDGTYTTNPEYSFYMKAASIGRKQTSEEQKQHLLKIAQDRYAQYKAREEEVG